MTRPSTVGQTSTPGRVSTPIMGTRKMEIRMEEGVAGLVVPPVTPLLSSWNNGGGIGNTVRG